MHDVDARMVGGWALCRVWRVCITFAVGCRSTPAVVCRCVDAHERRQNEQGKRS